MMTHMKSPLSLMLLAALCLTLAGCGEPRLSSRPVPPLFQDMARYGLTVDLPTAASVFSGYRHNFGLSAVEPDPRLVEVAREMAATLAGRDDIKASLTQTAITERLNRRGIQVVHAGENVSAGYHTLAEAFSGWRGSKPHDHVLKLPGATHFGIAAIYAPRSKYSVFWVLVMARKG
ncbi:MAG: CAP domain-containing protein [Hyphomicrobiales bacterium]|nr:CAP domain-containing protein [Hyphomicrobiales bacterium]OQW80997.1 MAG: hypothetical protein BVN31_12390 [Proteobacteria bacterium ST_bin15]